MVVVGLRVGDRVRYKGRAATVRFLGATLWCTEERAWVGIELDERVGKHDGIVDGTRYFQTAPEHAIFARCAQLSAIGVSPEAKARQSRAAVPSRTVPASVKPQWIAHLFS